MLRAFRWNLRILSYISLLVGAFLIYNTIAVSVVRRRTRSVSCARSDQFAGNSADLFGRRSMLGLSARCSESGSAGCSARHRRTIAETVNALFTTSTPGAVALSAGSTIGGIATGTAVAFFSALIPASEAARSRRRRQCNEKPANTKASEYPPRSDSRVDRERYRGDPVPVRSHRRASGAGLCRHAFCRGRRSAGLSRLRAGRSPAVARDIETHGRCGRADCRAQSDGVALAHIHCGDRARHSHLHDGERGRDGGEFSRDRAGVAGEPTARRYLYARRRSRLGRDLSADRSRRSGNHSQYSWRSGCRCFPGISISLRGNEGHLRRGDHRHRTPPGFSALSLG